MCVHFPLYVSVALLLGALRMAHTEVRSLVLLVDDEKLTEQILQQLGKYLPGKDEVRVLILLLYV